MPRLPNPVPTMRPASKGGWRVVIGGIEYSLGRDLADARKKYARLIDKHAANPPRRRMRTDVTIVELITEFLQSDESPRSKRQREQFGQLGTLMVDCFESAPAANAYDADDHRTFKAWLMAQRENKEPRWCRTVINSILARVRRLMRFGRSRRICPAENVVEICDVKGVRIGDGRETEPVGPAAIEDVQRAIGKLLPTTRAACLVQLHTAARMGEILAMRPADLDRAGAVWIYRPAKHKDSWRGKKKAIYLGPQAQAVLGPMLEGVAEDDFIFSPARSRQQHDAGRSTNRATKLWPSHARHNANRRKSEPKIKPGSRYTTGTIRKAIERACDAAGVDRFSPHRLRHLASTRIREQHGLEAAQSMTGHSHAAMTDHYSRDAMKRLAVKVAEAMG